MRALFAGVEAELGPIEICVFNIGANVNFPISETTAQVYRKVWEMAAFAGFLAGREAARLMALAGAEVLIYPTAIGADPGDPAEEQERQRQAWITIQRAHAIANGVPVLVANRVGHEADPSGRSAGIRFWGSSFAAGPQGEFLAQAGADGEELLMAGIDLARAERVRRIWPFLRDRRIDAYADLLKRYRD